MEKRVFLAFALSLAVLLIWSRFTPSVQPPTTKAIKQESIQQEQVAVQQEQVAVKPDQTELSPPYFEFTLNDATYVFSELYAAIKEVKFNAYQRYNFPIEKGFLLTDKTVTFTKEKSTASEIVFTHVDENKKITKRFIFSKAKYNIDLAIEIENLTKNILKINLPLILGELNFNSRQSQIHFEEATVSTVDKILRPNIRKDSIFNELKFIALKDRYFCAIIEPEEAKYSGFIKKTNHETSEFGIGKEIVIDPGQNIKDIFHIYLGPQELKRVSALKPEWAAVINYGSLDFIAQILLQALDFLFAMVHNWGVVIIILSILIYLALYPLSIKQMRSMKDMQKLQPKIDALKVTYKDNPQRLNKEIFELYRIHKVNPYSGCLPLILQIPVFFALYQVLVRSVALKGAHFLWIQDLSSPDKLWVIKQPITFDVNLLPLLMVIAMFFQQKFTTVSSSSAMNEQQKILTVVFPIVFGFIFYNMPSGLVLYWFINNILMLITQLKITKHA